MREPKRGAFLNSATGYGKHRNSSNPYKSKQPVQKAEPAVNTKEKLNKKEKKLIKPNEILEPKEDPDAELNSGFGNYIRSEEGWEMIKLFIFANTAMTALTVAWPMIKEYYIMFSSWYYSYESEHMVGPFMQGALLMGIIYWYSKSLFNLINDYYRQEFSQKLKAAQKLEQQLSKDVAGDINPIAYDLNDIEDLIQLEEYNNDMDYDDDYIDSNYGSNKNITVDNVQWTNALDTAHNCFIHSEKQRFFNILYKFYKLHQFEYDKFAICWSYDIT